MDLLESQDVVTVDVKPLQDIVVKGTHVRKSGSNGRQLKQRRCQMNKTFSYKSEVINEDSDEDCVEKKTTSDSTRKKRSKNRTLSCDYTDCNKRLKPKPKRNGDLIGSDDPLKLFHCDYADCDMKFATKKQLKGHRNRHWREANRGFNDKYYDHVTRLFICNVGDCQKTYKSVNRFKYHLEAHTSDQTFTCDYPDCNKQFNTKQYLTEHYVRHKERKIKCHYIGCDFKARTPADLSVHLTKHSSARPFVCEIPGCSKAFKAAYSLKVHTIVHNKEPVHKCKVGSCDETFFRIYDLYKHRVNEHNFKPYKRPNPYVRKGEPLPCDWPGCDFVTNRAEKLKLHKYRHTGDMPYVCDWPECGKKFPIRKHLTDHKNIHNNYKPYACHWPGCAYRCNSGPNIYKHVKQVHNK
ncbi:unnamed protein product [Oppiella nova]|uniref:C2H2-type domain-containing protein n=1 Tax=Oppiella nova TaxID=334625 RepID=A0A7R9QLH1_9ACAR|nr:unnamed protein product [Oppiella nova]CAG2168242.1 unnamed protein product [Oppiella nova]